MARFKKDFDWEQIHRDQQPEEEIIYVSKSEIKRDAQDYRKIAAQFVELNHSRLATLGLSDTIMNSIQKARSLNNEAKRRETNFVAKQLRTYDLDELKVMLEEAKPTAKTSSNTKIDKQIRVSIERLSNPKFTEKTLDLLSQQLETFDIGKVKSLLKESNEGNKTADQDLYNYFYEQYRSKFGDEY